MCQKFTVQNSDCYIHSLAHITIDDGATLTTYTHTFTATRSQESDIIHVNIKGYIPLPTTR
jgi:hypothetical protein